MPKSALLLVMRERAALLSHKNHILCSLSPADLALLAPHMEAIDLPMRFQLEHPNKPIEHIYFPDEGIVSVVATTMRDQQIEVGIIGHDGMTGHPLMLGTDRSPIALYMQIPGKGSRIRSENFKNALKRSDTLRLLCLRFVQSFIVQASHTALANGRAKLDVRLARWLIMAHDRLEVDRIPLTHEFLSVMLGVRRPGISVALKRLEELGLLETQRSAIIVKNRAELEKLALSVYGIPEAEQERLTGWRTSQRDGVAV